MPFPVKEHKHITFPGKSNEQKYYYLTKGDFHSALTFTQEELLDKCDCIL